MAVLLQVHTRQVQLLIGHDVLGELRGGHGIGDGGDLLLLGGIGQQLPAGGRVHGEGQGSFRDGHVRLRLKHLRGAQVAHTVVDDLLPRSQGHPGGMEGLGGVHGEAGTAVLHLQVQRTLPAGVLHIADLLVGHEVLGEGLFLEGLEPGEVRLVVAVHAGHQLDVGAVCIGEVAVPGLAEVSAAPGPLLLAGGDVVVGNVQDARLHAVVVAAHEVIVAAGAHIGGGHRDILVPADVHAHGVIVLVVHPRGDGEGAHVPLAVVVDGGHVRGEDALRVVIDRHGGVGPPQEGLGQAGAVVQLAPDLDVGLVRVDGEGHLALGAVHLVNLGKLHGLAAVGVFADAPVHRGKGGGPVVLGPVELDAAGNPRPGEAHQRGLDHLVVVHEVIAVGLVIGPLDAPAQLRQHHHLNVLVFQEDGSVGLVLLFIQDLVHHGQGVDLAAGALVDALFQEHGVTVRLADAVGGDHDGFHADACGGVHGRIPPVVQG